MIDFQYRAHKGKDNEINVLLRNLIKVKCIVQGFSIDMLIYPNLCVYAYRLLVFSEKVCEYKTVLSHEKVFHVPRQMYYYTHVKAITITFTDTE